MWGHDFRPDYLFIRRALESLGRPTLLGMTATATPGDGLGDRRRALGREPEVVRTSVVRPNLRYDVEEAANEEERLRILVQRLRELAGAPAILYARSRRSTETLARVLSGHGFRAAALPRRVSSPTSASSVQDAFVGGSLQVVTATTAFGMGIDKPDVRLVALVNHPDSLESYVQMIGRAGRDGAPSDTLLLAGAADAASLRRFALGDVPRTEDLRAVYRALRDAGGRVDPEGLVPVAGDHDPRVLVGMLEQAGLVRRGYDEGRAAHRRRALGARRRRGARRRAARGATGAWPSHGSSG